MRFVVFEFFLALAVMALLVVLVLVYLPRFLARLRMGLFSSRISTAKEITKLAEQNKAFTHRASRDAAIRDLTSTSTNVAAINQALDELVRHMERKR